VRALLSDDGHRGSTDVAGADACDAPERARRGHHHVMGRRQREVRTMTQIALSQGASPFRSAPLRSVLSVIRPRNEQAVLSSAALDSAMVAQI
jgi:hypothetical protein